jgi:hypothetical protein
MFSSSRTSTVLLSKDDEVLVRVHAASLNQGDLDYLYGEPLLTRMGIGLRAPRKRGLGLTQQATLRRLARTSLDSSPVMRCLGT